MSSISEFMLNNFESVYRFRLQLHGNAHGSCTQLVSVVIIGRVFEHVALRHLLLFSKWLRLSRCFFIAHALIASSISTSGKLCSPVIDRDVISSTVDFAISTSLIQCIVKWRCAVFSNKRQFWSWSFSFDFLSSQKISDNPSYNREKFHQYDSAFHFLRMEKIESVHVSSCCLYNIRYQILRWRCQILWIVEDCRGLSLNRWSFKSVSNYTRRIVCVSWHSRIATRQGFGTQNSKGLIGNVGHSRGVPWFRIAKFSCIWLRNSFVLSRTWVKVVGFLSRCMDDSSILACLAWSVSSQHVLINSSISWQYLAWSSWKSLFYKTMWTALFFEKDIT